jgi:hypothetical protein
MNTHSLYVNRKLKSATWEKTTCPGYARSRAPPERFNPLLGKAAGSLGPASPIVMNLTSRTESKPSFAKISRVA